MNINLTKILEDLSAQLLPIIQNVVIIVVAIFLGNFILKRISKYTTKTIEKAKEQQDQEKGKKVVTAMTVIRSVARYMINFFVLTFILNRLGFGSIVNNVLVTAGIGSLAISFGAQSIVSDVVAGVFLMFEQQFAVGDFVKIGEYEGTVISIAMRVTYLRSNQGQKIIIPNGTIKSVINYSNDFSLASILIPTPYDANTTKVMELINDEAKKYYNENKGLFVEEFMDCTLANFNDSSVDINLRAKCKPLKHWKVQNDMRLAIKERFDKDGISIPFTTITISNKQ